MGRVWLGILVCFCVVGATIGAIVVQHETSVQAAAPPPVAQSPIVAFSSVVDGQYEQITVMDPVRQVMGVYRVDANSGKIRLCSVRSLYWDLQMVHFNGEQPLPLEIQEMQTRGAVGGY